METLATSLPAELFRPRSLAMLMGVYEANYRRLLELFGDPARWPARRRLRLRGRPDLHVEVRTRSRYTTEFVMTYRFGGERLPDLSVRLYRDARLAEAVPLADKTDAGRPFARLPARWQANLLLYKWLEYCLEAKPVPA